MPRLEWSGAADLVYYEGIDLQLPDIPAEYGFIWRAYQRLDGARTWLSGGLGGAMPAQITWRAIADWAEHHGYGHDEYDMLDKVITAMDAEFVKYHQSKVKQSTAAKQR